MLRTIRSTPQHGTSRIVIFPGDRIHVLRALLCPKLVCQHDKLLAARVLLGWENHSKQSTCTVLLL